MTWWGHGAGFGSCRVRRAELPPQHTLWECPKAPSPPSLGTWEKRSSGSSGSSALQSLPDSGSDSGSGSGSGPPCTRQAFRCSRAEAENSLRVRYPGMETGKWWGSGEPGEGSERWGNALRGAHKGVVGQSSTQDAAAQQQQQQESQQQQRYPDGLPWRLGQERRPGEPCPKPCSRLLSLSSENCFSTHPHPGHKPPYLPVTRATNFSRPGGGKLRTVVR